MTLPPVYSPRVPVPLPATTSSIQPLAPPGGGATPEGLSFDIRRALDLAHGGALMTETHAAAYAAWIRSTVSLWMP